MSHSLLRVYKVEAEGMRHYIHYLAPFNNKLYNILVNVILIKKFV
jgi:hypothetical protein